MPIALTRRGDAPLPPEIYLQGGEAQLALRLGEYARAGLQHLLMYNLCAPEAVAEQIERIAHEVLPAVAGR